MITCLSTGFTPSSHVAEAAERLDRTVAGLVAARVNLAAYQRQPGANAHVVAGAERMITRLDCQRRVRLWNLRRLRGW